MVKRPDEWPKPPVPSEIRFDATEHTITLTHQDHNFIFHDCEPDTRYDIRFEEGVDGVPYLVHPDGGRINHGERKKKDNVNHPSHYGGADNVYEVIKVIMAWGLGFNLGSAVKYIGRAGKKDPDKHIEDLEKAAFYINYEIAQLKERRNA
jgi:hypothetical protein